MAQVIHLAIVAPAFALRAGLRAILSAAPAPTNAGAAPEVVFDGASLGDFEPFLSQTDVLVLYTPATPGPAIRRIALQSEGRLALLFLTEDFQAARTLVDLPLRAWGVLSIDSSAEELLAAVAALNEGLLVGTPALLKPVVSRLLLGEPQMVDPLVEQLTERESQVLQLLARGLANKQIAMQLGISENTVKFHVSSIYTKLGATNRTEAVRIGVQQGLVLL